MSTRECDNPSKNTTPKSDAESAGPMAQQPAQTQLAPPQPTALPRCLIAASDVDMLTCKHIVNRRVYYLFSGQIVSVFFVLFSLFSSFSYGRAMSARAMAPLWEDASGPPVPPEGQQGQLRGRW